MELIEETLGAHPLIQLPVLAAVIGALVALLIANSGSDDDMDE